MKNFEVRPTHIGEAREYAELRTQILSEQFLAAGVPEEYVEAHINRRGDLDSRTQHLAERLEGFLADGGHILKSVYDTNTERLCGFFVGDLDSSGELGDKVPNGKYVGTINLARNARGLGIGRTLMTDFMTYDSRPTYLHVLRHNRDAHEFYARLNFTDISHTVEAAEWNIGNPDIIGTYPAPIDLLSYREERV